MRILVINGPNLNMLGVREKELYGDKSYSALIKLIKNCAKERKVKVKCFQSNYEGAIVTKIQKAHKKFDGIVINPGAYTHTSIALLDAVKAVSLPTVEVHISDPDKREPFRRVSYIREACVGTVCGMGTDGYLRGIDILIKGKA